MITKNASFICPVSNDLAVSMQSLGLKGNYKRIPNVVDTFIFKPIDSYPKIFTMVHISNMLNDHKNVIGILEVLADLKKRAEFQFKLIGENSSQYKAKVRELKMENEVEFIDHIPHSKIPFSYKMLIF
ncbi:MAG: glycosyltransferase [Flavobacteriaceae bacterium]